MDPASRHPAVPAGYRLRAASPGDADAVSALKCSVETDLHGKSDMSVEYVREEWALPGLDLARDSWVVEEEAGALAGYGICWMEEPPDGLAAEQLVEPGHRGKGLGELLLGRCEARAVELARGAGHHGAATLAVTAHESDARRMGLLERRGYSRERAFLRLDGDLDGIHGVGRCGRPGSGRRPSVWAWTTPRSTPPTRRGSTATTGPPG